METDAFSQKRMELMIDMATKKLQQEINSLKEHIGSLNSEMGSLKSQVSRIQFQPQKAQVQRQEVSQEAPSQEDYEQQQPSQEKRETKIVDCRPHGERTESFQGGSAKNSAEPIRPRFGDYQSKDVSIEKFFYFGNKR
ncbi:MAG: hypothetical protein AABX00_00705 [Nanoarchaeota archaeon]